MIPRASLGYFNTRFLGGGSLVVRLEPDVAERPGFVGVGLGKVVPEGRGERYLGHVFHDLRHTFAIELYAATRDVKYLSKQLGHKSTVVTGSTYLRFSVDLERREIDLDAPRGARRSETASSVVG